MAERPVPRVLVVDDDESFRHTSARLLGRHGLECHSADSAASARSMLKDSSFMAVLCDIKMPQESGLELLPLLGADFPETAVVMTTGVDDPETAERAFAAGADAYLVKPITPNEMVIAVQNALRRRELERSRRAELAGLEQQLQRYRALDRVVGDLSRSSTINEIDLIERLSGAISLRDEETALHLQRVSLFAGLLAAAIGWSNETVEQLEAAAALHDVGKIGVPDTILLKPGPLSPEERAAMKRHPHLGHRLLAESPSPVLEMAASVALGHHEWWDGQGYPAGVKESEIPEAARIAAIADVFDALTSDRVYRARLDFDDAVAVMLELRGRQFEPRLLDAFLDLRDEFVQIRAAHPDTGGEPRIRVLIVDDHEIFVQSLSRLLSAAPTLKVVGAARSVREGYEAALAYQPDVILMDFELPDGDGIQATRRILGMTPSVKVVMLTGRTGRDALVRAVGAGCAGFVKKTDPIETLLTAVQAAHDGDSLAPIAELNEILTRLPVATGPRGADLSPREVEVLDLVGAGLPNKLVARRLDISINTVGNHVRNILYKLGAHSRLEAVAVAIRTGLIDPGNVAADGI
ncbi:MAG TPA: response regulator [Mycobacteriales bacterium]|jgi:putative two-component system response regulator|nr:response regulator [Mycobacteriales bacterium]